MIIEHVGGKRLRVLSDSLRVVLSGFVFEIARITFWSRDWQRGIGRINIYRGNVQLVARMRLLQIEAAHSSYACEPWNQLELDRDEVTPFAFAEHELLLGEGDSGNGFERVNRHSEGLKSRRRSLAECVVRTDEVGGYLPVLDLHRNDLSAFDCTSRCRGIVGVERKCSVGAA